MNPRIPFENVCFRMCITMQMQERKKNKINFAFSSHDYGFFWLYFAHINKTQRAKTENIKVARRPKKKSEIVCMVTVYVCIHDADITENATLNHHNWVIKPTQTITSLSCIAEGEE